MPLSWRYPAPREIWELRLQRLGLALLLLWRFPLIPRYSVQPFPVGVANWIDLTVLGDAGLDAWVSGAFCAALLLYVLGRAMVPAVGTLLVLWVGAGALSNSQGSLGHDTQLVGLVLLAQWLAYVRGAWSAWRGGVRAQAVHELAVDYTQQVIVASYLLAGMMKVVLSRGTWIAQVPNIGADIVKVHGQRFADSLDPALLARGDRLATFALAHTLLMRLMMGCALFLELTSPLALLGRGLALIYGVALIGMHRGIEFMMMIRFYEHEVLLLLYFVNLPYLLVIATRWLRRAGDHAARTAGDSPAAG
ncbi:MAG: hypothetical protein ABI629_10375 [bacterium]